MPQRGGQDSSGLSRADHGGDRPGRNGASEQLKKRATREAQMTKLELQTSLKVPRGQKSIASAMYGVWLFSRLVIDD